MGIESCAKRIEQLDEMKAALLDSTTADETLYSAALETETLLLDLQLELSGDDIKASLSHSAVPGIMDRVQSAYFGTLGQTYGPTQTHRQQFDIARNQYDELRPRLLQAIEQTDALGQKLDAAGVKWTSGRDLP